MDELVSSGFDNVLAASATRSSAAVWKRSAGDLRRQRATTRATSAGTSSGFGSSRTMAAIVAMAVSPEKARRPLSIS